MCPAGAPDPRQLPVVETRTAEFVVVGGGLSGTCAAVAAARRGVETVLVQDRPVLGGNASSEVRVWCAGEARYDLVRELRGMFMNMEAEAALSDARRMGIVLNEPNLTVLLSTRVFAAEKGPDNAISSVTAFDLKRGRVVRIAAPLFADATGDGCAAGEAAALCKKYGIRPRGVYSDGRVRELQDALGGEFPGRPDPKTAGWAIVDDDSDGVTFSKGWVKSHCALGEQVGDYAHFPDGHAWGPNPKALRTCGEAVYPLPVPAKGRYALMGRIPFVRTTPDGSATAFEIVSGGRTAEFTFNQAYATGVWNELGTFELEPSAVLKIIPKKSHGIVAADAFAIRTK